MRIAIVTFVYSQDNYGQLLQAYALCQYLTSQGHTPYVINYRYREPYGLKHLLRKPYLRFLKIKAFVSHPKAYLIEQRQIAEIQSHDRAFDTFRDKHIPMTEKLYDQYELQFNPPEADIYISGSDQIWSLLDSVYFLQFVPDGKRCLAYASSCGGEVFNDREKKVIKKYISRFSFVGLRENHDAELIKGLGFSNVMTVVDPTMLLTSEEYDQIAVARKGKGNYVLVYFIGNKFDFDMANVYQFAQEKELEVKYIASQGRYDDFEKEYPTPEEWLGLIRDASYVITNSYHGTVFSLIYNRNFTVIPQKGTSRRMNTRITDLLQPLGLENRIYQGRLDILETPIIYDTINHTMIDHIANSKAIINKYLGNEKRCNK